MHKAVLVTGAAGKLGSRIVQLLRQQPLPVIGIDLLPGPEVSQIVDITDKTTLQSLMPGVANIVHTAALHGRHMDLNYSHQQFVDTNISGTLNLLSAAAKTGVQKFVFTSSTSIYGHALVDHQQAVWIDEKVIPRPRDIYDITKQAAEALCQEYFQKSALKTCVLRVSRFMKEPLNDIANYRLYRGLDPTDGAQAHILALNTEVENFEVFNISNKSPFQPADLPELKSAPEAVICKYYPQAKHWYDQRKWSFPTSIDRVYDIQKAQQILKYQPQFDFEEFVQNPTLP